MILYQAVNRSTGKRYIGLTRMPLSKRKAAHWRVARRRPTTIFAKALRSYGMDAFDWSVMLETDDFEFLTLAECEAIRFLKTQDRAHGYNVTAGGEGYPHPHSAETRAKIALAQTGKKRSVKVPLSALADILARRAAGDSFSKIGADYRVRKETVFYFVQRHAPKE